jgi:hypothetical protein
MQYVLKGSGNWRPRRLIDVAREDRSRYLDAKINAACGLCPEPKHPLDYLAQPRQAATWGHYFEAGPKRKY